MDKEIDELCKFLQFLNQQQNTNLATTEENSIVLNEEEIFEDIKNFNNFVKKYGHTGGWDDIDHSIFVNLTRKHNLQSVIHHLRRNFPDISEEDIIKHDKWYRQYLKLKSLQQRAFKFWNIKKKENDRSRPSTVSSTSHRTDYSTEETRQKRNEMKIKIRKWKEYKIQMKQNEEELNSIKLREKEQKDRINKIKQENARKAILEYREEKIQIQQALWIAKLVEENDKIKVRRKKANKMLPLFRKKDQQIIRRIQEQRKYTEKETEKRKLLIQKIISKYRKTINVERDPMRLLSPTVEWRQKILKKDEDLGDSNIFSYPYDITNIPHLAIPRWRKNIHEDY